MSFFRFVEGAAPGKRLKPNPKTDVDKKPTKQHYEKEKRVQTFQQSWTKDH